MTNIINLPKDFFWKNYVYQHPDLILAYGNDKDQIENHYIEHGFYEHRRYKSNISLIVCSMNRTDNLIPALTSWINTGLIGDIVVVDYNSDTGLYEHEYIKALVDNQTINLITVKNEEYFNQGKAYNLGIDFAKNDIIIKIDADHICIDDSWIKYLYHETFRHSYLICDHTLCYDSGLSGFISIYKNQFMKYGYKEDLNDYGHDDIDLYSRLEKNKNLKKIIFFDIENHIKHIKHEENVSVENYNNKTKKYTNTNNRLLCAVSNTKLYRQKYYISNNIVKYKKNNKHIDKTYCINLDHRYDRWCNFLSQRDITRFPAISNKSNIQNNNLLLSPVGFTSYIYFKLYPNAFYTYLSHYYIWHDIVNNNIEYALILEDDIDVESLTDLYESNLDIHEFDYIQLSHRLQELDDRIIFNGGESYILNRKTAIKLLCATHFPLHLKDIVPHEHNNIEEYLIKNKYYNIVDWPLINSITSPVDKFMGYCCESNNMSINSYMYPIIRQSIESSIISDIIIDINMDILSDNILDNLYNDFFQNININSNKL